MQALFVVDIDHYNNWKPDDIEKDGQKKQVAEEIKRLLEKKRARNEIIIFIVLSHRDKITGQEAQLRYNPQDTVQNNESLISKALKKLGINYTQAAIEVESGVCVVCDELTENYRLAPFLEHRHREPFEATFIKNNNDAFTNLKLTPYLRSIGVDEVVLAGCLTFACVLQTASGALRAGFDVTLLSNCVFEPFSDELSRQSWIGFAQDGSRQSKFTAKVI